MKIKVCIPEKEIDQFYTVNNLPFNVLLTTKPGNYDELYIVPSMGSGLHRTCVLRIIPENKEVKYKTSIIVAFDLFTGFENSKFYPVPPGVELRISI